MLAKLAKKIPTGEGFFYEPKWDGMRCVATKTQGRIELWSRNGKPLARYFPELVSSIQAITHDFILDGEIILRGPEGMDFATLLLRLHPAATRVRLLSQTNPATFVAFDLLELDGTNLEKEGFEARRRALERVVSESPPFVELSPITADLQEARGWLENDEIEGIVAKHRALTYRPGKRAMIKVKKERTADCVVGGFRWHHSEPQVGSLLLGIYEDKRLIHVGLATAFKAEARQQLTKTLVPYVSELQGHPWEHGFRFVPGPVSRLPGAGSRWSDGGELTWVPLRPELVCEVSYDRLDGTTFRHPARFRRWRPDRDPESCTWAQFRQVTEIEARA